MKTIKRLSTISVLAAAGIGFAAPSSAQQDMEKFQISEVTCREILTMPGDEQDFTIVFFHGFVSGKENVVEFDAPALGEATGKILDHCIGNPDDSLLSAFETVR